jgi:hypothetical protein
MANERYDFVALRTIEYPKGQPAYLAGHGVMAQVVEDLGLIVGEDVAPARPDVIPEPSGNASRAEWAAYAIGQGMTRDEADDLTRDELRARFAPDEPPEPPKTKTTKGAAPAKGA